MERSNAFDCPNEFALLCAGHCTHHKGEPIFFNYGSQGKSQAQPDGGEGCSGITTGGIGDCAPEGSSSAEAGYRESTGWSACAGTQTRCLLCSFVSVLTSRIAGYVISMSGGVGGALSDGCPYPYIFFCLCGSFKKLFLAFFTFFFN